MKLNKFYVYVKSCLSVEKYVNCITVNKFRRSMASFRCSSHHLAIETGRHSGIARELRFCLFCKNIVEDEYHFVIKCPLYKDLREVYIPPKYYTIPSLHKFYLLIAAENEIIVKKLSMYLFYADKVRQTNVGSN